MGYGRSCVFSGCYTNDDPDILPKIGFMKIPTIKNEDYQQWKKQLLDVIKRYQVLKPSDYERMEKGKMFICYKHFEEKDMYITSKDVTLSLKIILLLFYEYTFFIGNSVAKG